MAGETARKMRRRAVKVRSDGRIHKPCIKATIHVIPTFYRGAMCRSRLEARWLVCLDELGIRWQYEPEGYFCNGVRYLPDIWLPQVQMFAEVKPNDHGAGFTPKQEALDKAIMLAEGTGYPVLFLDGPPRVTNHWAVWPDRLDPVGWAWEDVNLFDNNGYHISEQRLFASTGTTAPLIHATPEQLGQYAEHPAVMMALSARFERNR